MKKTFAILAFTCTFASAASAITPSGSLELASRYIWRGTECAAGPCLFTSGGLEFGNFTIGAWGAYAFDSSVNELDLSLGYTLGNFTLGLTDYYYPTLYGMSDKYFNWKSGETGHLLEGTVTYAPEAFPLTLLWSTMLYGDDRNDDKPAFSSYFEASYAYDFGENNSVSATLGASVLKGFYTGYEQTFSVINIAFSYTKTLEFDKVSMPLSVSYVLNPEQEKSFLTATVGISF